MVISLLMSDPVELYTYHLCVVSLKTVLLFGDLPQFPFLRSWKVSKRGLLNGFYQKKTLAIPLNSIFKSERLSINNLVPVSLPQYLSFYLGGSRLRHCHLDSQSLVSSIVPRSSQSSIHSSGPLSKSFFYRTHLLWNSLPLEIRQISCPSSFKSHLTKHFWSILSDSEANTSFNSSSMSI